MLTEDPLFELINSLTKSEKRYFRLYASRHTIGDENKYIIFFDHIQAYSGPKNQLYSYVEQLPGIKNIAAYKHYLYKLILKSLHAFNAKSSVEAELQEQLHVLEILQEKKLFSQCLKLINKAKQQAIEHEKFSYLLEIIKVENNISANRAFKIDVKQELNKFKNDYFETLEKLKNLYEYRSINDHVFLDLHINPRMSDAAKIKAIRKFLANPLLRNKQMALSFTALTRLYRINIVGYFILCDYNKVSAYTLDEIKTIETRTDFARNYSEQYFTAYCNLFVANFYLRKLDLLPNILGKLKNIPTKNPNQKNNFFLIIFNLEIGFYNSIGQFKKSIELYLQNEEQVLELITKDKHREMEFYYCMGYAYMGLGKYDLSNKYMNKIVNNNFTGLEQDLYCLIRVIALINNYELGNRDLLEYTIRSTYRFLVKKDRLYKYEKVLLAFIRNTLDESRPLVSAFKEVKSELLIVAEDKYENKAFLRFDFISWLNSKIHKKPFVEFVQARVE